MFGSTVLEVAIGLALIYLTLSMLCSALTEYTSSVLSRRSRHLRDALIYLFNQDNERGLAMASRFFQHPLIKGLAPGRQSGGFGDARLATWAGTLLSAGTVKGVKRLSGKTPQYIPDTVFADVMFDLLRSGGALFDNVPDQFRTPGRLETLGAKFARWWAGAVPVATTVLATPRARDDGTATTHLRDTLRTALQNVRASLDGFTPGHPDVQSLRDVIDQKLTLVQGMTDATPADDFWRVVEEARRQIRNAANGLPRGDSLERVRNAIAQEETRLRTARANTDHVNALRRSLTRSLAVLQGAGQGLPDGDAKNRLLELIKQVGDRFQESTEGGVEARGAWDSVITNLGAVRGHTKLLPDSPLKTSLLSLIDTESTRLTSDRDNLITVENIRRAVSDLPESELKHALGALMDEEGENLDAIKDNLKNWYNDTTDRVSGWYKRNTQFVLFWIALIVSALFNADTIRIARSLSQDSSLRTAVAASAQNLFSQQDRLRAATGEARSTAAAADTALAARQAEVDRAKKAADDAQAQADKETDAAKKTPLLAAVKPLREAEARARTDLAGASELAARSHADVDAADRRFSDARAAILGDRAGLREDAAKLAAAAENASKDAREARSKAKAATDPAQAARLTAEADRLETAWNDARKSAELAAFRASAEAVQSQLQGLGVPVGWQDDTQVQQVRALVWPSALYTRYDGFVKVLGLLLTTIALSMGGPFWYDLLNRLVNVSSTGGKPPKTTDGASGASD